MKKQSASSEVADPLDDEIDFSNARPNPFAAGFGRNKNIRILAPELLDTFPDSQSVNEALRTLVRVGAAAPAPAKQKLSAKTAAAPRRKGRS
jgi:hypothetical protein